MLTWNVTYDCKPGQRDAFFQALCQLGVRNNSIHEEGNLKYDYFFVTGNSSYMALNNLYCQHMIPGSKGLNPHELAQMWVNVLETRQNMSLKVGRKHHDMRIFCRIVGVRST